MIVKVLDEKIIVSNNNYYKLGDVLEIKGEFKLPNKSTTPNLFDYRNYLKHKNIFYIVDPINIKKINHKFSIINFIKEKMIGYMNNNRYLYVFILGDKSLVDKEITKSYQENGISHLFAISGMHITLLSGIITKLLRKKLSEEASYKICSLFLVFYLFLVGFSPSILRGVLFYILFELNKIYYFYIKKENIFLLILSLSLIINPYYVFDTGFQFSYLISFSLLEYSDKLSSNNYFISLIKVSIISFLVGIPICLFNYYQINLLSIIYNLFFVPYISLFLFPFTFLSFIFPFLRDIYCVFCNILENSSLFISNINLGKLVFMKISFYFYILYELLIILFCIYKKKCFLIIFLFCLLIHFLLPYFDSKYVSFIDQTTPNMIQRISGTFERNPLISKEI